MLIACLRLNLLPRSFSDANENSDAKENWIFFARGDYAGELLSAMKQLGTLDKATEVLASSIDRSLMQPLLSMKSRPSIVTETDKFCLRSTQENLLVPNDSLLEMLREAVRFLYTHLPDLAVEQVGQRMMPNVVSALISTRLSSTIPTELSDVSVLQQTRDAVSALADDLKSFRWPGQKEFAPLGEPAPLDLARETQNGFSKALFVLLCLRNEVRHEKWRE